MSIHDPTITSLLPASAPLEMRPQDLSKPFRDDSAPQINSIPNTTAFRLATFAPAAITTAVLIAIFLDWFKRDGVSFLEFSMLFLAAFSVFWIALSVATATIGLFTSQSHRRTDRSGSLNALNVALLVPIYNEDPDQVFRRIRTMCDDLIPTDTHHRYAFFILSDTRDAAISARELEHIHALRKYYGDRIPIFYRRRATNIDRKSGNIRDWVTNWGAAWDAFVVLDADSLMSARAVLSLADSMSQIPDCGLLQSVPRLIGANSVFSRVQQFSNNIYGSVLACGLERWAATESNFWGHNAIIRTGAFARCAGLPILSGRGPLSGTIKSHDFVEAALLRRAGWSVRLVPELEDSYEEVPQTLIDYVLRDRRWCQGNLQHLRLLTVPGLKLASRFHLFQGAMAYIASLVWFFLLLVWALMGKGGEETVFRYFSDTNPHFPAWPEMDFASKLLVLGVIITLLLVPKFFAIAATIARRPGLTDLGGRGRFALSCCCEIVLSFILAPIMMIQHVIAIGRTIIGLDTGWSPQNRDGNAYSLWHYFRFHSAEAVIGFILSAGMVYEVVSLWLLPVSISLLLAVPASYAMSRQLTRRSLVSNLLRTSQDVEPNRIVLMAMGQQDPHISDLPPAAPEALVH